MTIPAGFTEITDESPSIPEGFSLVPEGFSLVDEEELKKPTLLNKAIGAGETGLSLGTGLLAQIPAGVGTLLDTANELTQGRFDTKRVENTFSNIQNKLTYEPRTELGKEYTEDLGKSGFMQSLNAVGGVAHTLPPVRTAPAIPKAKAPTTPRLSKLDALKENEKPMEAPAKAPDVSQPELDLFGPDQKQVGVSPYDAAPKERWVVDENGIPVKQERSQEMTRAADEATGQQRLFEDPLVDPVEIWKKNESDRQAYEDLLARQDSQKAETRRLQEEQMYRDREQQRVDAKKQAEEAVRQSERDDRQMRINEALEGLQEQLSKERVSKGQQRKANKMMVPRGQRGAIDVSVFDKAYDQVKRVGDLIFRLRGGSQPTAYAIELRKNALTGEREPVVIAHANFGRDNHMQPTNGAKDNLQPTWVQTMEGHQRKGLAQEMYKFVASLGHDIVPDNVQTPAGKALWDSMERKGIAKHVDFESFPKKIYGDPEARRNGGVQLPKNQRGAIDFGAPKEKIAREVDQNFIPDDPSPQDIIRNALAGKDSNSGPVRDSLKSGATLTAMIKNSPLIQGIGQLYQNAQKRAELNIRQRVYPVEQLIKKLPKEHVYELAEVLKREMFQNKLISADDLRQSGFTEAQIEAYARMRQMFNEVLQAQNEALIAMGREPMTPKEAYLSSRWNGDWHIPVFAKDGSLIWYIAEHSRGEALKAAKWLRDNGVDMDMTKSKLEYAGNASRTRGPLADAYLRLLDILDKNDPRTATLKEIYEQGVAQDAFKSLGQSRHFETKSNVRGFIGDRPWKDPTKDAIELFQSQFDYTKNAYTWLENSKATDAAKQVFSESKLDETQPNNMRYARDYAKGKLGFGENAAIAQLEKDLAQLAGRDRQSFSKVVGGMKSFFILGKLGFNLGFILSNYIQPLWTAPWHSNLSSQGFAHNPFTTFVNGFRDGHAGYLTYASNGEAHPAMSALGKEALRYAEDNGIVSRDMFDESANLGKHPGVEFAEQTAGVSIKQVEHMARINAFMGFVHHLEQSGKFGENRVAMFQKAEELTNAAMVDYRPGEGPMLFDKMGTTGDALASLQRFKFNYYNQLHYFLSEAADGKPRALITFLALQGAVGGMLSMPFLQEIEDAFHMIKGWLPHDLYMPVSNFSPKKWMVDNMPDWASYGGVSKITGANMSSRFDSGNIVDFSMDGLFPFLTDLYKQGTSVAKAATNPNQTTLSEAAYRLAPPGPIQGALETNLPAFNGGQVGDRKAYFSPNKLEQHEATYLRTPGQEAYRRFGLTELEEAKYREQRYRQIQDETEMSERQKDNAQKWFDAMFRQDKKDMEKYVGRYIAVGGDPQNLLNRIQEEVLQAKIPRETLDMARAQTLTAVQKAKRLKEILNGSN